MKQKEVWDGLDENFIVWLQLELVHSEHVVMDEFVFIKRPRLGNGNIDLFITVQVLVLHHQLDHAAV